MLLCRDLYDPGAVMQKTGGKYIMVKAVVGANWGDEGKGKISGWCKRRPYNRK